MQVMEKVYYRFWAFLNRRLATYDGRCWSWAGDGGIMAFALKGSEVRAVEWALEVQATLPIFNADPGNPISDSMTARIGLDCGKIRFRQDTGRIVSDVINFASHLEKDATDQGHVSVSDTIYDQLPPPLAAFFIPNGKFEERPVYTSFRRVDESLFEEDAG
jgi:class 3 adenylate cyclase